MKLVIAEKPSVASSIAKVLNATEKHNGYIKNEDYIITWCVGHLISLASADLYNEKYSYRNIEDLPIIPENWKYTPLPDTKKQFVIVKKLMLDESIDSIICATDSGREGELIFRLLYNYVRCKKPVERLWISSMEDAAIKEGFKNLKNSSNYDSLYKSALCRSQADWLVGINFTRLFTSIYNAKPSLNIGRVMTPTLSMIVERNNIIKNFQKEKFYNIELKINDFTLKTVNRIDDEIFAKELLEMCNSPSSKVIINSIKKENKLTSPPLLYDLTTLQRESNRIFGYSAKKTLDCVQSLYEKKIVTYPRTDSRYLTEDMKDSIKDIAYIITDTISFFNDLNIEINSENVINDKKVTDHHAIIPTKTLKTFDLSTLNDMELNILTIICTRFLSALNKNHTYIETELNASCCGVQFGTKYKTIVYTGYKHIEDIFNQNFIKTKNKNNDIYPDDLYEGQIFKNVKATLKEGFTSPPKYFTEDTLLSAMENVDNDDFKYIVDVEKKGLGTPATRAGIIEKLIKIGFIKREKKNILPTEKGEELIKILPEKIKSPKLTANWEYRLSSIEKGDINSIEFIKEINCFVNDVVNEYKEFKVENSKIFNNKEIVGKCPRCGKDVISIKSGYVCEDKECGFAMWKKSNIFTKCKVDFTKNIAKQLLKNGEVYIENMYSPKKDTYFNAFIVLFDEGQEFVEYKIKLKGDKK